jgi:predicted nucleic acid-binding OB-fold protein
MIQINRSYGIRTGVANTSITLCKSHEKKGEIIWIDIAYFNDLYQALDKLVNLAVLKGIDRGSWRAVVEEVAKARRDINDIKEKLKVDTRGSG